MTETQQPLVQMTEDEWSDKYKPVGMERDGSGTITRDAHEIPHDVQDSHLWTLVETKAGEYFIPGWHRVNHVAFVVTQIAWEHENIEVEMDQPDF